MFLFAVRIEGANLFGLLKSSSRAYWVSQGSVKDGLEADISEGEKRLAFRSQGRLLDRKSVDGLLTIPERSLGGVRGDIRTILR